MITIFKSKKAGKCSPSASFSGKALNVRINMRHFTSSRPVIPSTIRGAILIKLFPRAINKLVLLSDIKDMYYQYNYRYRMFSHSAPNKRYLEKKLRWIAGHYNRIRWFWMKKLDAPM